jgi:hypothetical protein
MRRDPNRRRAATGKQRPGPAGRYITQEQLTAALRRLTRVDRRLGLIDARLESAQRIRF